MNVTAADRARALAYIGRVPSVAAARGSVVLELRGPTGAKLDGADLDALLADAVARKRVMCEVDLLAYEQGTLDAKGKRIPNRKGMRIRDGALAALARSGVGTPFMRDHDAGNTLAKGGEIVSSKLERGDNGYARIVQTARLMDPGAVERAARGLLSAVSIHAVPMAGSEVMCTACGSPIFAKCYHLPLDVVSGDDGEERTVEWEFSDAELIETSECPIPAVQNAGPMSPVRAALALAVNLPSEQIMTIPPALVAKLKLAATAGEGEYHAAVENVIGQLATAQSELAIANTELARQGTELTAYRAAEQKSAEDKFIGDLKASGKIAPVDEEAWRTMFQANKERAVELAAKRPAGCAVPVGVAAQSAAAPAPDAAPSPFISERQRRAVLASGMTEAEFLAADARYRASIVAGVTVPKAHKGGN